MFSQRKQRLYSELLCKKLNFQNSWDHFYFTNPLKLHVPVIQDYKNPQNLLVRYKISPFYWYMGKPNARDQNAFFNPFDSVSDNSWYKCEQEI